MTAAVKYTPANRPVFASNQGTWWGYQPETTGRPLTFAEAWEQSDMGRYEIVERPMATTIGMVDSHKALYLQDNADLSVSPTLLNVVTKDRKTWQPREGLALAPAILEQSEDDPIIETLGMLGKGGIWYATVLFPQTWRINGDEYKGYLVVTDRVDGSYTAAPTPVRIVCSNTYQAAMNRLKGVARYVGRHTSRAVLDPDAARRAIGMLPEYMAGFQADLESLHAQDFTLGKFLQMTDDVFGKPDPDAKTTRSLTIYTNRMDELTRLWRADTQESTFRLGKPTKATAYHAMVEYLDHTYGSKDGRTKRIVTGEVGRIKADFNDLLLASA